jgi:predicted RNase H-like nuclease (RuvC/YqgF family)
MSECKHEKFDSRRINICYRCGKTATEIKQQSRIAELEAENKELKETCVEHAQIQNDLIDEIKQLKRDNAGAGKSDRYIPTT